VWTHLKRASHLKDSFDLFFLITRQWFCFREWLGKEVVTVYQTDIGNNSTFYTDSNGRRWMKRIRNSRTSWNLTLTEPTASNYYPITTGVYIADKKTRLNVLVDRPEGASSMENGTVEIMVSSN
jgi:Glycosyl hydrolases family 38 C-terminal domain.